jgi:hypothetical protein
VNGVLAFSFLTPTLLFFSNFQKIVRLAGKNPWVLLVFWFAGNSDHCVRESQQNYQG